MNIRSAIVFVSCAVMYVTPAMASCTGWMLQEGGWYWRECVDDQGHQTCWHAKDANGTDAYQIACS